MVEFGLIDDNLTLPGRARHWLVDSILGGAIALVAITVAQAALPHRDDLRAQPKAAPAPAPVVAAAPETPSLIAFRHPLPGREVGSPFGLRQMPWEERGRLHAGVDIAAPARAPILAVADGVVTRLGQDQGYGRFIEVKHAEGLTTLYGHLGAHAPGVTTGTAVKAGTTVGLIGSTGSSTGDHLHFEIHDARGRPMNPEMFLGKSFATLADLPLKAALRAPRGVRVAYVSRIPAAKQAIMRARNEEDAVERAALDAASAAADAGVIADSEVEPPRSVRTGRPRARIQL